MATPSDHNENFRQTYPDIWNAFEDLAGQCHDAGPLDEKTRRLVKLALAIGSGLGGATHSAVRHAEDAGITREEMAHVAVLGITTMGFPASMRALSWIKDSEPRR